MNEQHSKPARKRRHSPTKDDQLEKRTTKSPTRTVIFRETTDETLDHEVEEDDTNQQTRRAEHQEEREAPQDITEMTGHSTSREDSQEIIIETKPILYITIVYIDPNANPVYSHRIC